MSLSAFSGANLFGGESIKLMGGSVPGQLIDSIVGRSLVVDAARLILAFVNRCKKNPSDLPSLKGTSRQGAVIK